MNTFNIYGLIIIVILLIPNAIYAIKHKEGFENRWKNKSVEILEQIGRFGCFGLMIFNVPGTCWGWWLNEALAIYLVVNTVLVLAYLLFWAICFNKMNRIFSALALSITPSLIFIFSGVMMRSLLLLIAAAIFVPCHILISYKNANLSKKKYQ